MRRLETQSLLQFAAAAVPVLRTLTELDQRMTYKQFGIAIGLVDQRWEPWHRQQVTKVLDTAAAANRLIGDAPLDHRRIVNQSTGVAGAGAERNVTIREEQS